MTSLQIRAKLQAGEAVSTKLHGNSMTPRVKSGDTVLIEPLRTPAEKGDVVFCKVNGRFYLHLVTAVHNGCYQIGNNHGHINGWTKLVYGRLVSVC